MTPARDPKQEKSAFPFKFQGKIVETSIFEVLGSCRIDPYRNFLFSSYPDLFRPKSSFLQPFLLSFPKVSEGFQGLLRVSKGFQRLSKGFQGIPMVPEGFRMFLIFYFFPLYWTLSDVRWLMIDDWRLMIDDWWWMMTDNWLLMNSWLMVDDWWLTNWRIDKSCQNHSQNHPPPKVWEPILANMSSCSTHFNHQ